MVGVPDVFQHMPRAVIAAPPLSVILPPLDAVVYDIEEIAVVEIVGTTALDVVKLTVEP